MGTIKKNIFSLFLLLSLFSQAFASTTAPIIDEGSITPKFISIGDTTQVTVYGKNLFTNVVGVSGQDTFAFVLDMDPNGKRLIIQITPQPSAAIGQRTIFLRNSLGEEATFNIDFTLPGIPRAELIIPNTSTAGSTLSVRVTGSGLKNISNVNGVIASDLGIKINSFQEYIEGTALDISLSIDKSLIPGNYQIFINTKGGQTSQNFTVLSNSEPTNSDFLFSADPNSPGISLITVDPTNRSQIILKGSMFNPDPNQNIVTILENNNGNIIGRQVEVISSNNNEIIINIPRDINSNSISIAVSNADGKSSNIKTVNLDSLLAESITQEDNKPPEVSTPTNEKETTIINNTNVTIAGDNTNPSTSKLGNPHGDKQPDLTSEKPIEVTEKLPTTTQSNPNDNEDPVIAQKIHSLTQYLFGSNSNETKKDITEPSINEIQNPAKLISSIEENKQLKSQVDLIMIALEDVKHNQAFSEAIKKTESLKIKVEELEKLLKLEKLKNDPDPKKLAKYQQLLLNVNAESRSQTFTLLNNLLKYKPQLKNLLTQKPLDLATIQPNIPDNALIIQYVPTEEGIIIFVVDNKSLKTRINKNISKDILNREIQAYRQLLENEIEKIKSTGRVTTIISWKNDKSDLYKKEIVPIKEKSIFFYNSLIAPIEKDILNKKVLAIITNGWLRYLPFQALAKPLKDGELKFLISDKSIVYLDSVIAISKSPLNSQLNTANITIFANPDSSLTGANKEAELISTLFSKSTVTLIQKSFNIPLINQLAKKADILHIATHGYLDSKDIDSSYLVVGNKKIGKKTTQEKLFLKDIYDLNLNNSKLIVLSGCDTGRLGSLEDEPEDIVGSLAAAFRIAGANTIIASLWKAHDEATKIIMQNFYENLKAGLNKAEALRIAELKLKENPKYSHPLFWSPFNLIGDWR